MNKNRAIPLQMTLLWNKDEFSIELHHDFITYFKEQLQNPGRVMADFLKRNPSFVFNSENYKEGIGLNKCLTHAGNDSLSAKFKFKILPLYKFTENKCENCNGTGESNFADGKCYECRGTGKEKVEDVIVKSNFDDFCLTMYIFCKLIYYNVLKDSEHGENDEVGYFTNDIQAQQTMMYHFSEDTGQTIAYSSGWLHDGLIKKVLNFSRDEEKMVNQAMYKVEAILLMQDSDGYERNFKIITNEDKFWLQVPGSACTLGIEDQSANFWDWGKILSPHNVDHRFAQMSFMAGLAVIDGIAKNKAD